MSCSRTAEELTGAPAGAASAHTAPRAKSTATARRRRIAPKNLICVPSGAMRALVTGGELGSRVARALVDRGHGVRTTREDDVLDPDRLIDAGRGMDVAYYLADAPRGSAHAFA